MDQQIELRLKASLRSRYGCSLTSGEVQRLVEQFLQSHTEGEDEVVAEFDSLCDEMEFEGMQRVLRAASRDGRVSKVDRDRVLVVLYSDVRFAKLFSVQSADDTAYPSNEVVVATQEEVPLLFGMTDMVAASFAMISFTLWQTAESGIIVDSNAEVQLYDGAQVGVRSSISALKRKAQKIAKLQALLCEKKLCFREAAKLQAKLGETIGTSKPKPLPPQVIFAMGTESTQPLRSLFHLVGMSCSTNRKHTKHRADSLLPARVRAWRWFCTAASFAVPLLTVIAAVRAGSKALRRLRKPKEVKQKGIWG